MVIVIFKVTMSSSGKDNQVTVEKEFIKDEEYESSGVKLDENTNVIFTQTGRPWSHIMAFYL